MSSEGPKMVGGRYGLAENGRKVKKSPVNHGGRRRLDGPIRARLKAVGLEIWPVRVQGGWPVTPPTAQNPTARKWFKMIQFGSTCFEELL